MISTQDTFPSGLDFVGTDQAHFMQLFWPYRTETWMYPSETTNNPYWPSKEYLEQVRGIPGQALPVSSCD